MSIIIPQLVSMICQAYVQKIFQGMTVNIEQSSEYTIPGVVTEQTEN